MMMRAWFALYTLALLLMGTTLHREDAEASITKCLDDPTCLSTELLLLM